MDETADRKKRVRRLKKFILWTIAAAIIIPVIGCILLSVRLFQVQGEVKELKKTLAVREQEKEVTGVFAAASVEESPRDSSYRAKKMQNDVPGYETGKKIYLTFDDGPSSNTDAILDILSKYGIKATFFVVGKTDERSKTAYKRIVQEGHTLAMHSYSHKYSEIYASVESFAKDLASLQEYLYDITGVWSRYYRFPGGSSNTVSKVDMQKLITYLNDSGITYFDWNVASGDAVSGHISADHMVDNCMNKIDGLNESMILFHDASDKSTTVDALKLIIDEVMERGDASFYPITDDTVPVQHVKGIK